MALLDAVGPDRLTAPPGFFWLQILKPPKGKGAPPKRSAPCDTTPKDQAPMMPPSSRVITIVADRGGIAGFPSGQVEPMLPAAKSSGVA